MWNWIKNSQRGLALVTVLWVLVLLSLIAASFTATTRTEVNVTRNIIDNAKAEALADAGVYRAIYAVLHHFDHGGWRVDGTPYLWRFAEGEVIISIQDEAGKVDLNRAPDEVLRGLLLAVKWTGRDGEAVRLEDVEADALVDAIRDFADEDDLHRLNGAEDPDYEKAGLPWDAKDARFQAVEELQQVLGMRREIYQAIEPVITVHNPTRKINRETAPALVLRALSGLETETSQEGLAVNPSVEVPNQGGAKLLLAPRSPERAEPNPFLTEVQRRSNVGNPPISRVKVVTIRAEARAKGDGVFVREAVIRLKRGQPQPFQIEAWKQGQRRDIPAINADDGPSE
jgi:general secretion pathway protein K